MNNQEYNEMMKIEQMQDCLASIVDYYGNENKKDWLSDIAKNIVDVRYSVVEKQLERILTDFEKFLLKKFPWLGRKISKVEIIYEQDGSKVTIKKRGETKVVIEFNSDFLQKEE